MDGFDMDALAMERMLRRASLKVLYCRMKMSGSRVLLRRTLNWPGVVLEWQREEAGVVRKWFYLEGRWWMKVPGGLTVRDCDVLGYLFWCGKEVICRSEIMKYFNNNVWGCVGSLRRMEMRGIVRRVVGRGRFSIREEELLSIVHEL